MDYDKFKDYKQVKNQLFAETYHNMLKQMPKEVVDHIEKCISCRRLSQQTVTKILDLIYKQTKILADHLEKPLEPTN